MSNGPTIGLADLYAAERPRLVRRYTARTRDPELAADLVQEAFLRLHRELAAGRSPDCPAAWLERVLANLLVSHARRSATARRASAGSAFPSPTVDSAEATCEARERRSELAAAIARLRPIDQRALALAGAGHGSGEIAVLVGRTAGATRTSLHRARRALRGALRGDWLPTETLVP